MALINSNVTPITVFLKDGAVILIMTVAIIQMKDIVVSILSVFVTILYRILFCSIPPCLISSILFCPR